MKGMECVDYANMMMIMQIQFQDQMQDQIQGIETRLFHIQWPQVCRGK